MRTEVTVRATTSNAIQFQLLSGTVPLNLSGYGTIELYLKDNAGGTAVETTAGGSPKLSVNGAAGGSLTYTPGSASLVAGSAPYNGYFKCHVTASSHLFVPEDSEFTINVRPTF